MYDRPNRPQVEPMNATYAQRQQITTAELAFASAIASLTAEQVIAILSPLLLAKYGTDGTTVIGERIARHAWMNEREA